MDKAVTEYTELFRSALTENRLPEINRKVSQYRCRLETMYASDAYRKHNAYPTMNVERVYAVIAICLELKTYEPALTLLFSVTLFSASACNVWMRRFTLWQSLP